MKSKKIEIRLEGTISNETHIDVEETYFIDGVEVNPSDTESVDDEHFQAFLLIAQGGSKDIPYDMTRQAAKRLQNKGEEIPDYLVDYL